MIDARLNFKYQVEHGSTKAAAVRGALSRLMPNEGGPKPRRRALLASVVTSILTYGIAIWASVLELQECQRMIHIKSHNESNVQKRLAARRRADLHAADHIVERMVALRVFSGYRTISTEAAFVIAGVPAIVLLARERTEVYNGMRKEEARTQLKRQW
ncbi:uncharacterized protein LOC124355951 [Homalodisca vitripennis]|uniref:uncharacterized protein LOC124355951 n=1 Tax=Homalodisca vitripennis TaxID=197043 RepID=UPI001EE9B201|nr:uncharacterized protein LOC124355951 [Homalodisca vitripennis]